MGPSQSRDESGFLELDQDPSNHNRIRIDRLRQTGRGAAIRFLQREHGHHVHGKRKSAALHAMIVTELITLSKLYQDQPGSGRSRQRGEPSYGFADGLAVAAALPLAGGDGEEDPAGDGEEIADAVAAGDGVGVGFDRMSSQVQRSPLYPPISFSSDEQRSCSFCKSGGPGGSSAVPGKTI